MGMTGFDGEIYINLRAVALAGHVKSEQPLNCGLTHTHPPMDIGGVLPQDVMGAERVSVQWLDHSRMFWIE